jgi:hypothetical protein
MQKAIPVQRCTQLRMAINASFTVRSPPCHQGLIVFFERVPALLPRSTHYRDPTEIK